MLWEFVDNKEFTVPMRNNLIKTTEQWVELIAQEELPAITSTVHLLDSFANDDVSSLTKLSKAILHDQALSSCVLKIANNVLHIGHVKVTTVSRATVVLGIQAVKNICLTSKLIEGLLQIESFSPVVFGRLTRLMATSFYSGLLARMMVPDYNDDTKEQVYLAAMLYRIGESAFWSVGGEASALLIEHGELSDDEFDAKARELIGSTFTDMSKGLAASWNLGDLLEKSLDQPESRTVEIQIIALADKLARFIDNPPETAEEFNAVLEKIAVIKKIPVRKLKNQIIKTRSAAIDLLHSFGADMLIDSIKPLPTPSCFHKKSRHGYKKLSKEQAQLNSLMKLTELTRRSKDFNDFLELTLKSLAKNSGFERSVFFMLSPNKQILKSRSSLNVLAEHDDYKYTVNIGLGDNLFLHSIKTEQALLVNDHSEAKWREFINQDAEHFISDGVLCIAPVKINNRVVGVITGQFFEQYQHISEIDFLNFSFLIEHLNMCLSLISRKK